MSVTGIYALFSLLRALKFVCALRYSDHVVRHMLLNVLSVGLDLMFVCFCFLLLADKEYLLIVLQQ